MKLRLGMGIMARGLTGTNNLLLKLSVYTFFFIRFMHGGVSNV